MRYIYNTTYLIDEKIETAWVEFVRANFIPFLEQQNPVKDILFTKVSIDQPEGKTYSLQLFFDTEKELNDFSQQYVPILEEKMISAYKNRYLCFSSMLKEI